MKRGLVLAAAFALAMVGSAQAQDHEGDHHGDHPAAGQAHGPPPGAPHAGQAPGGQNPGGQNRGGQPAGAQNQGGRPAGPQPGGQGGFRGPGQNGNQNGYQGRPGGDQAYRGYNGQGYNGQGYNGQGHDNQDRGGPGRNGQGYDDRGFQGGQRFGPYAHGGQGGYAGRGGGFDYHGRSYPAFHVGAFRYPRGYGYQRWSIGQRLPLFFLSPAYFINYGIYDLGPPAPGCEWVRYGPDALMVNQYTGQVVDVAYGVFY